MKDEITELRELCADIRKFIQEERLSEAKEKIALGMAQHPDAGIPHNLMGIVKEIENDRVGAMKHFRSAYALNPKNTSIRKNIDSLCAFRPTGKKLLFGDEDDERQKGSYIVEYDEQGIGHIVRKRD